MVSTTQLEYITQAMEDNLYDFTKDGKCSGCGECCSNMLPMSKKEIVNIHRYIKKNFIKEAKHFIPLANNAYDMICPFRDNGKKVCTIYPVRPEICKEFICNNEQRAKNNRKLFNETMEVVQVREEFFNEA